MRSNFIRLFAVEVMSRKNVIRYFNSTSYSVGAVALISCLVGDAAKLPPLSPAAAVAEHAYSFFRKACFYLGGVSTSGEGKLREKETERERQREREREREVTLIQVAWRVIVEGIV
ncbi:hypothetical protein T4E_8074 [Trichinella pseudospiralis]|uniref:Uncharacterized protein n=1 Tax=Trichinella pseudospiralis TaxID=6337 RepID=A0A0V0XZY7_TRIPS|nr:hypothetical protein T4E_8074 [Trichinella pseudospiralis]